MYIFFVCFCYEIFEFDVFCSRANMCISWSKLTKIKQQIEVVKSANIFRFKHRSYKLLLATEKNGKYKVNNNWKLHIKNKWKLTLVVKLKTAEILLKTHIIDCKTESPNTPSIAQQLAEFQKQKKRGQSPTIPNESECCPNIIISAHVLLLLRSLAHITQHFTAALPGAGPRCRLLEINQKLMHYFRASESVAGWVSFFFVLSFLFLSSLISFMRVLCSYLRLVEAKQKRKKNQTTNQTALLVESSIAPRTIDLCSMVQVEWTDPGHVHWAKERLPLCIYQWIN